MKLFLYFIILIQFMLKKVNFFVKLMNSLIGQRIEKGMLPEKEEKALLGKRITKDIIAQTYKKLVLID